MAEFPGCKQFRWVEFPALFLAPEYFRVGHFGGKTQPKNQRWRHPLNSEVLALIAATTPNPGCWR
ncbi:hypothetical protein CRG98_010618 [Punica granatum]|uniref:Uncharacterized protein n=1 Tax=Punica granatum TaxID=22663 RepID=A0A2I0KMF5_PUNGR|nr:hypothetical protein CRG98_010618 [Punica granatum]